MLFRSFIESEHYGTAEMRCYDCHQPHNNKAPTVPGILQASETSDDYCLRCHGELASEPEAHTMHIEGTSGSYCYDCHMPRDIVNIVSGELKLTRTHDSTSIPHPAMTLLYGQEGSPNACTECHADEPVEWAAEWTERWWGEALE
jgi:predicted CXXCH cytochrome family protein